MATGNRQTARPRSSATSPRHSAQPLPDAVDLVQGPDGVWAEPEGLGRLEVEAVALARQPPAAVTERGADEASHPFRPVVFTNGPKNGCVFCGRAARKIARVGPVSAKVCGGCAAIGSRLLSLFR